MRINSGRGTKVLLFVYLVCVFALVFDLVISNIDGSWGSFSKVSPIALLVFVLVWYRGLPEFLYDSDGEVLNFTSQDPHLIWFSQRLFKKHSEFPKRKLASFTISRLPFRRSLVLRINSKGGGTKKERFTISYLSRKERKDLQRSLKKVVENNKQRKNVGTRVSNT